jgi:DNA invertase Pin-like site-specific DNA recombinase
MTVQQEFIDEAVSGTKDSSDRPAMMAMIAMMQASGVSTVLVETSSRFARDLIVSEILVKRFQANGFRVIDCSGNRDVCDSSDPMRVLVRQLLGGVDQYNKCEVVTKLAKARARIRAGGQRCEGKKPYGVLAQEVDTLNRILSAAKQGISSRKISDALNADGVPTRTGKVWNFATVAKIIRRAA